MADTKPWYQDHGVNGNIAVPFDVLDGETFEISPTELAPMLTRYGCQNPDACVREFEAYGVTKFDAPECGRHPEGGPVTLRLRVAS